MNDNSALTLLKDAMASTPEYIDCIEEKSKFLNGVSPSDIFNDNISYTYFKEGLGGLADKALMFIADTMYDENGFLKRDIVYPVLVSHVQEAKEGTSRRKIDLMQVGDKFALGLKSDLDRDYFCWRLPTSSGMVTFDCEVSPCYPLHILSMECKDISSAKLFLTLRDAVDYRYRLSMFYRYEREKMVENGKKA